MTENINRTRLIQRLDEPTGMVEMMSGTGLSSKAKEILKDVCDFDYMGSSEFEFGEVPKTFGRIAQYCERGKGIKGDVQLSKPVLYLCRKGHKDYVVDTISKLAEDEHKHFRLKETCWLKEVLEGNKYTEGLKGWLEMDNDFMFFVDSEMAKKFYTIFEVE